MIITPLFLAVAAVVILAASVWFVVDGYRAGKELERRDCPKISAIDEHIRANRDRVRS